MYICGLRGLVKHGLFKVRLFTNEVTMKNISKHLCLGLICTALTCSSAMAQNPTHWDIEQCIEYALNNNIQIKQSQSDIQQAELSEQQAKMAYIPSLNASAAHSLNSGRSLDPTTYEFINNETVNNLNSSLSLSTTIFAGMEKKHQLERSRLNLQAAVESYDQLSNEITIAVTRAYLQLLFEKESIINKEAQIESITEQVERTKILVKEGAQPHGTLLELQAQLSSEQYNLVALKNSEKTALLTLKQLLELQLVDDFDIAIPTIETLPRSIESTVGGVFAQAQELPQIELAKLQTLIATSDLSLAKASLYPRLTFGLNYGSSWSDARMMPMIDPTTGQTGYENYPFFDQMKDNASLTMNFSLSVPIFNGLNARRGVKMAHVSKQRAELGESLAQNQLLKEIQQAHNDASGALEQYYSAEVSLKSSELSFEYAQQKFDAGASTSVDYTTAKNNLIIAQSSVTRAKYQYLMFSKILDFYCGTPITL